MSRAGVRLGWLFAALSVVACTPRERAASEATPSETSSVAPADTPREKSAPSNEAPPEKAHPDGADSACARELPELPVARWAAALTTAIPGFCLDATASLRCASNDDAPRMEAQCAASLGDECEAVLRAGLRHLLDARLTDGASRPASVELRVLHFASPEGAWTTFTRRTAELELAQLARPGHGVDGAAAAAGQGGSEENTGIIPIELGELALRDGARVLAVAGAELLELRYADGFRTQREAETRAARVLPQLLEAWLAEPAARTGQRGALRPVPRSIELLPVPGRQPLGVRYYERDALGVVGAGHAAIGAYREGDTDYRIFIASHADEAAAKDAALVLRRQPGSRSLKDVPFDAFELSRPGAPGERALLWLIGRHEGRVAGVASAPPPATELAGRPPGGWLERARKMTLLRAVMARRR